MTRTRKRLQALGRPSRAMAVAAGVPPSIVSKNHRTVCPRKRGARISRPPAPKARTSWVRGRPRPHVCARCGVCGEGPPLASVRADGDVRARRPRTQAVRAFGAGGRGALPGCAGVRARTFARGAAFAGRGAPTRQRSRGWRRAGETPAHPDSPRLRRDRARRTSWVRGRLARTFARGAAFAGRDALTRQRSRGWRRAGETPAHPGSARLRRGRARGLPGCARASPPARLCVGRRLRGGAPYSPAFARMETCGRDARAPRKPSARGRYTRKAFMASSPRQLTTFTAMRPEAGRGKGRDVSLFSAAQASGSISAFRDVFSAL